MYVIKLGTETDNWTDGRILAKKKRRKEKNKKKVFEMFYFL